jgi:site-specific recombinase XerD
MARLFLRTKDKRDIPEDKVTAGMRGMWYLDYYGLDGKRRRQRVGRSRKSAQSALKHIEVDIEKGRAGIVDEKQKIKPITVKEFFEKYLVYAETNLARSSVERYCSAIANFQRFLSGEKKTTRLIQLNPEMIERYKTYRRNEEITPNGRENSTKSRNGVKANTLNFELTALKTAFNVAIKWGYLKDNPTQGVKQIKVKDARPPRFLTKSEIRSLLEKAEPGFRDILMIFLNTGMRRGEVENLRWEDIDLKRRRIKVRCREDWNPKGTERNIPINDRLLAVLTRMSENRSGEWVIKSQAKRNRGQLRPRFVALTKKCGLAEVTQIHVLRHTFASHLVMNGVDLPTVQKLLGHADIQTTMIYAHLAPDHLVSAVEKLSF